MLTFETRFSPTVADAVRGLDFGRIERAAEAAVILEPGYVIGYVNPAWISFALDNAGEECLRDFALGAVATDAISEPLRTYYESRFSEVLERDAPWEHTYLCPSPTVDRSYRLRVGSLPGSAILIENELRACAPRAGALEDDLDREVVGAYLGPRGTLEQCAHCRRVRRPNNHLWDFQPQLLARGVAPIRYALCNRCFGYYRTSDGAKTPPFPDGLRVAITSE